MLAIIIVNVCYQAVVNFQKHLLRENCMNGECIWKEFLPTDKGQEATYRTMAGEVGK